MAVSLGSLLLLPRRRLTLPRVLVSDRLCSEFFESDVVGLEPGRTVSEVGIDPVAGLLFLLGAFVFSPSWGTSIPSLWETYENSLKLALPVLTLNYAIT